MIHGTYKSYQDGNSNLVATVWQDNRIVILVSTNSNPRNVVHTDRRLGHNVIQVNQPQNIQLYNRYMNGVDHHDQTCMKYDVGYFSVKAWKYILWYFVNTGIMDAYILNYKTLIRQTKKKYAHLDFDFQLEIAMGLTVGFSSRKRKAEAPLYIGPVKAANENNHENVHMGSKEGKRCKWHCMQQMRNKTVYGCHLCKEHLCKDGCHIPYHNQHFTFIQFFFIFETSLDISPKLFMSKV